MIQATLLANAGILLCYGNTTMLVDGIYGREPHYFSNLKRGVWEQMLQGEAPFESIDYLLFTHDHPDHFSAEMIVEFLRERPVKGVFLPDSPVIRESGLDTFLAERKIPFVCLSREAGNAAYRVASGVTVRAIPTRHLDKKFQDVQHLCYLLTFGEKSLLFTADADYTQERFESIRRFFPLRAAFINPLFFGALRHGRFFSGELDTQLTCVYHVPFAGDDPVNMRSTLVRDVAEWPKEKGEIAVLDEAFQRIIL